MKTNKNNGSGQQRGGEPNEERKNEKKNPTPVIPSTQGGKKNADPSTPPPGLRFPERSIEHQHQEEEMGHEKKQHK